MYINQINQLSIMKAIVFDRDGTLIEFVDFLYKDKDVVINKDFILTLKFLNNIKSLKLFIHTNQSGVLEKCSILKMSKNVITKFLKYLHEEI